LEIRQAILVNWASDKETKKKEGQSPLSLSSSQQGGLNGDPRSRARERGKGGEWRPEATPTGRGGDPETLHHPGLGPNRERASEAERSRKARPRDERR